MKLGSLKNSAKRMVYFLTAGVFLLSASLMINGTAKKYTQLAREHTSLLKTPDLQEATREQLKAVKQDIAVTGQRLAQYPSPRPGVLVPAFIQHLGRLAKDESVLISMITPKPQQASPSLPSPMTKTSFKIEMSGKFASLHRFITRLEKSTLPVRIEEFVMTKGDRKNLKVSLSAYILSEKKMRRKRSDEGPGEEYPARAVFTAASYQPIEPGHDIKRDIFFYPSRQSPATKVKKKQRGKTLQWKRRQAFGKATLSAVIYDGQNSMALLNGVILSVGDIYKGYTVKAIGRDQIRFVNSKNNHEIVVKEN